MSVSSLPVTRTEKGWLVSSFIWLPHILDALIDVTDLVKMAVLPALFSGVSNIELDKLDHKLTLQLLFVCFVFHYCHQDPLLRFEPPVSKGPFACTLLHELQQPH